jgi:hypothetical protein
MKLTGIRLYKCLALLLVCVILLPGSLPSFVNAAAVPPANGFPYSSSSNAAVSPSGEAAKGSKEDAPPPESITTTLQTPPYQVTAGSDGFDLVQIEGFYRCAAPGDPDLPGRVYNVALPPDVAWESVTVEVLRADTVELPGTYEIAPAPPPVTWIDGQKVVAWGENAASIVDGQNMKVYQNDAYFPASYVTAGAQSQMRKWRFIRLLFTPAQYNPATKKLRLALEVEVRIAFARKPAFQAQIQAELSDTAMDAEAAQMLYNYDQARGWYQPGRPPVSTQAVADYVIITTRWIASNSSKLSSFITHKQAKGHTVEVVTETQYGGLPGQPPNGMAEKIRQWLIYNYLTKGIKYVLLIGNPDPDDPEDPDDSVGDVPMKMCWPRCTSPGNCESPTDYFYADLTGNWDRDGDIYFGEYGSSQDGGLGGVDFAPEVYVGRIPVYTDVSGWQATLDNILQKIMDYEDASSLAWRRTALLPMSFVDDLDGARLGEFMKGDYLNRKGYTSYTLYQHKAPNCNSSYTSNENLVDDAVKNHWQNNDYGIVTWWGHGSAIAASIGCADGNILENGDTLVLDDSHPAIVYQCSCYNGKPEYSDNLGYALLRRGAVATVSASRGTWTTDPWLPTPSYADSASIGYYFMRRITDVEMVGKALYDTKSAMGAGWSDDEGWMNMMDFNIYGAPSTSIGMEIFLPLILKNIVICFQDDFSNPDSGWPMVGDANHNWTYHNGEYHLSINTAGSQSRVMSPAGRYTDFVLEVSAHHAPYPWGDYYALVFGIADYWISWYEFRVNSEYRNYSIWKYSSGSWTALKGLTGSVYINGGSFLNRLKVERSGSTISVYVNGYYLDTVYDGSLTGPRKVGLGGSAYSGGPTPIEIHFDNFQVCSR